MSIEKDHVAATDDLTGEIQRYRSTICHAFLISLSILAVPALAASLYRYTQIGWQPVMTLHILMALVIWSTTFFRNTISYAYKAGLVISFFSLIGIAGILQFGLIAGGTAFLVVAPAIAALLYKVKAGVVTFLVTYTFAIVAGILTVTGVLQFPIDFNNYAYAKTSWISTIIGWSLASISLAVSITVFNKFLINALYSTKLHEQALIENESMLVKANEELQQALNEIKTLQGIIPICSYCHNIRDDEGAWNQMEKYLAQHSDIQFSHGICPECLEKIKIESTENK